MKKNVLVIMLAIIMLCLFVFYREDDKKISKIDNCQTVTKEVLVDGSSMDPFIKSGDMVTATYNYYDCHDVLRDDVVLYDYSGNKNLLIKSVKAIPGDVWELKNVNNGYEIVVNGSSLLNHEGVPYLIFENSIKMLVLYNKDYPVIPNDVYLILGDKTGGTLDSTKFGLVGKKDILAKVSMEN